MKKLLIFIFFVFILLYPRSTSAIAVSPPHVKFHDLLRENVVTGLFNYSRFDTSREETYNVKLKGLGTEFVELETDTLIFKKGEKHKQLRFVLAPDKAERKLTYSVSVLVSPRISFERKADITNLVNLEALIEFSVTKDENTHVEAVHVGLENGEIEEGEEASIRFLIYNHGNVSSNIDTITIDAEGLYGTKSVKRKFKNLDIPVVSPRQEQTFSFPLGVFSEGIYNLHIQFTQDGDAAGQRDGLTLVIGKPIQNQKIFKGLPQTIVSKIPLSIGVAIGLVFMGGGWMLARRTLKH